MEGRAKRVFVAVLVSPRLRNEIVAWKEDFRHIPARWLAGKNLHITLVPPWYEEDVEIIVSRLKTAAGKLAPFEILFEKVSYGPDSRQPRLIWAEGKAPREIIELKSVIEKTLDIAGEQRLFQLHLTLARFTPRLYRNKGAGFGPLDARVQWYDTVDSFALMESRLSPKGADYEVISKLNFL